MLKLVLDTNIYLAAMGSKSFCYDLIIKLTEGPVSFPLFISEPIIQEIENNASLFLKEKIINKEQKEAVIHFVKSVPNMLFPEDKTNYLKDNPKDNKIIQCAVAAKADLIVTMDLKLLKLKSFKNIGIIHPKDLFFMLPKA